MQGGFSCSTLPFGVKENSFEVGKESGVRYPALVNYSSSVSVSPFSFVFFLLGILISFILMVFLLP